MHHCFMMRWLAFIYKKKMVRLLKAKLDYQPNQLQPDQLQPDQLVLPKWLKVSKE